MVQITHSELIAALQNAEQSQSKGLTVAELCEITCHCEAWVCKRLRKLRAEGVLQITKKQITDISGRKVLIPSYWIERKGKKS